ncbi:MAG: aminotransferase class III-fold pyridoxal phosphate-dependent enzyme [Pseudomonadota bacterium]
MTDLLTRRTKLLGPRVPTFYDQPVHIVKGEGVWLWDADGKKYLDCYNNVAHVGHCHPHVVAAIAQQAGTLNTHTRYLHETILAYIERLGATFADPLSSAILTCTGSEANDIALRMAEAVTGKRGIIVTDHTYHGNTTAVAQLSTTNPSAFADDSWVRFVPAPDSYRLLGGQAGAAHAQAFADAVAAAIADLEQNGPGFAGMLLCPTFVNEGLPQLDTGWLDPTLAQIRAAGGVVIADEVQPGFGRVGSHFWGHQRIGITPDIVTMGKPMGNGHPIAAVMTSADILGAFRAAFRYFNTFGGNPVSCAAAMAVLDVLEAEDLQKNAEKTGAYAVEQFQSLAAQHQMIGDVRGCGMIFGAELVIDKKAKTPAKTYADRVVNAMRQKGFLLSKFGKHYNTLKIRPPLPFQSDHVDLLVAALDDTLTELGPALE